MNPYAVIGAGVGTTEAVSLGVRLTAWHDAMVAHERLLRSTFSTDECHDELTFLRSRGKCPRGSARPGLIAINDPIATT
jgi:hypothetical protein